MSRFINKLSRTLSLVLRHDPASIGLSLDREGWASVDELLACLNQRGRTIDRAALAQVVRENNKQRFRFSEDGLRIRANQGHSIEIDLKLKAQAPPDILYHGTASRFMPSIEREGLKKMTRQHVHLSADLRTAHSVGKRHGKPVVLEISADSMAGHGFVFYLSENGVWLTNEVPVDYLRRRMTD